MLRSFFNDKTARRTNKVKQSKFGSRWGFVMAAVGSAVGMANVWGFPYKMGANGGGAKLGKRTFLEGIGVCKNVLGDHKG